MSKGKGKGKSGNSEQELFERYKRDLRPESLDDLIVLKETTDVNITEILKNRYAQDGIYVSIPLGICHYFFL